MNKNSFDKGGLCQRHGVSLKPLFNSYFCPTCEKADSEETPIFIDYKITLDTPHFTGPFGNTTTITIAAGSGLSGPNFTLSTNFRHQHIQNKLSDCILKFKSNHGQIVDFSSASQNLTISPSVDPNGNYPWVGSTQGGNLIEIYLLYNTTYPSISRSYDTSLAFSDSLVMSISEIADLIEGFDNLPTHPGSVPFYNIGMHLRALR